MPNQPPNFHESLNRLLVPTAIMIEAAKHIASGVDDSQVADAVQLTEEVVLVWHRLHLGFQEYVDVFESRAESCNIDRLAARNALVLELEIDDLEQAVATLTPVPGRKMSYCAPPQRRPRPPSGRDRLTKLVEAEYERRMRIHRDLDHLETDIRTVRKPNRQSIEVEIVEERLAAIKLVEEGQL